MSKCKRRKTGTVEYDDTVNAISPADLMPLLCSEKREDHFMSLVNKYHRSFKFDDIRGSDLHPSEFTELKQYPDIYYTGTRECKKVNNTASDGRYIALPGDHVAWRFKIFNKLGNGQFGDCWKAFDFKTKKWVALKIIKNRQKYYHQSLIEIDILKKLEKHDNMLKMLDNLIFRGHVIIVFELLGETLLSKLEKTKYPGFPKEETRNVTRCFLDSLEICKLYGLVHSDLKLENTVSHGSKFKVIDFGSSYYIKNTQIITYRQSRWYRAPEFILGYQNGTFSDMWSLACILYELDTGKPLFPCRNERELLVMILQIIGAPPIELLQRSTRTSTFFKDYESDISKLAYVHPGNTPSTILVNDLTSDLKCISLKSEDPNLLDFIKRILQWDPTKRLSLEDAKKHPWILGTISEKIIPGTQMTVRQALECFGATDV